MYVNQITPVRHHATIAAILAILLPRGIQAPRAIGHVCHSMSPLLWFAGNSSTAFGSKEEAGVTYLKPNDCTARIALILLFIQGTISKGIWYFAKRGGIAGVSKRKAAKATQKAG